jgi:hypothetical protein
MNVVQCPTTYIPDSQPGIFLAGGISNCSDWQSEVIAKLADKDVQLINPRRDDFDITNPDMSVEQICWEWEHLHAADAIIFYFAPETVCPITLYELGVHATNLTDIFVTCHPDYVRKLDVEIQLSLARPSVKVHDNIDDMIADVIKFYTLDV